MSEHETTMARLARKAHRTERRLALDRAVARLFAFLPIPLVFAVGAMGVIKVLQPSLEVQSWLLAVGLTLFAIPLAAGTLALVERQPRRIGALTLDRFYRTHDRITSALTFQQLRPEDRTPFMHAAIEDATHLPLSLQPRRAAPFHTPKELVPVLLLMLGLALISVLEVQRVREVRPLARGFEPVELTQDDLQLFQQASQELASKTVDAQTVAAIEQYNQLLQDIAARRVERRQVFQRLSTLERQLRNLSDAEKEAQKEGLEGLARELEKSELSRPVAKSLKEQKLADAEKAMRKLAERLKNKQQKPSVAALERLRNALKRASTSSSRQLAKLEKQRQRLVKRRDSLLKKKQNQKLSPAEQKELDRTRRKLERLDRNLKKAELQKRKLSELDRKLAEAARKLLEQQPRGAEDLEAAAQNLQRMAAEQLSDAQKRTLLQRLEQLQQLLRQQGKDKNRLKRLSEFSRRARGGKPGQKGKGTSRLGKSTQQLLVPIQAQGSTQAQAAGANKGKGDSSSSQANAASRQAGTGHNPDFKGDATKLKGQTKDVTAVAQDTGEGTASAEVIYGAAERGFVGRGYRKVYTDYKTVAERVINRDEVPAGYRFYVQRYFQLIRPRE